MQKRNIATGFALVFVLCFSFAAKAAVSSSLYWLKIKAKDKFERSAIANSGVSIEKADTDFVIALGSEKQYQQLQDSGLLITGFQAPLSMLDFPTDDDVFHNYAELRAALTKLADENPDLVTLDSIGKSVEKRELMHVRISDGVKDKKATSQKPGIVFMGGHHAREHLSIEVPLMLAQYLVDEYRKGTPEIVNLIHTRDIHIIPMVNPDGAEFDIASGDYQMWRKNRAKDRGGERGVDLNRNYSYGWGTGGSSDDPSSEVYMGTKPFSEPETRAIKKFIERNDNISILLTFHTFSQLILYPWGGSYKKVENKRDLAAFEAMATTMAAWNGYTPEQSSDLYIATGDAVDWAYGEHKIFGFTFEMDPTDMSEGGFYPGADFIPRVFTKNLKPCLYLISLADNPYRSTEPPSARFGLSTPLLQ